MFIDYLPANAKSLFKFRFGHENVSCLPIFKIFAGPIATNRDLDADRKIFMTSDFTH